MFPSTKLPPAASERILDCLEELATPSFQERVWLEGRGPEVSSPEETIIQLGDDSGLADLLAEGNTLFSERADRELGRLLEMLAAIDVDVPVAELLGKPAWKEVVAQAAACLATLRAPNADRED